MMVVYMITNLINGKRYIGIDRKNNKDYYGSGKLIKLAIKKYGKENFIKEILQECQTREELIKAEIEWIKKYDAYNSPDFYNITEGGDGGDTFSNLPPERKKEIKEKRKKSIFEKNNGSWWSEEEKKHFSEMNKGNKKLINSLTGRKLDDEHKKSIKIGMQLAIKDECKRNKISHKGIKKPPFTETHRRNLSESAKGKLKSKEHKEKLSKCFKGKRRCKVCNQYFADFIDLIKHLTNEHGVDNIFEFLPKVIKKKYLEDIYANFPSLREFYRKCRSS